MPIPGTSIMSACDDDGPMKPDSSISCGIALHSVCYPMMTSLLPIFRDNDVLNDSNVKQVVVDQTKQWSEMMERHRKEEWELTRVHLQAQEEVLKKLMEGQQTHQMKELETTFDR